MHPFCSSILLRAVKLVVMRACNRASYCFSQSTHSTGNASANHLTSCSSCQIRGPIRCQFTAPSGLSLCLSDSSSALRQLPRMHLSSCRSDLTTFSCSLIGCSHCWRRCETYTHTHTHSAGEKRNQVICCKTGTELNSCTCAHTLSSALHVSCSSRWQRLLAIRTLHCSLSSHTSWPSNTAFHWWL